ncbi:phage virion morphogenesis protein [Metapseudomonas otitidis]|uniref:phage virion morphogenesis protein n=1 Tax=Metapseudomonas otitidis TaxID=319939 RepID=UPI002624EEFF|nr:phage virion morphogenesis protein [Pseudomonas otitidis]
MADTFDDLSDCLTPLNTRLQPTERTRLARQVAQGLRRSQQQRIVTQRNPDGSAYAPRKPRELRAKAGRIKRKARMFTKLRTARYLKAQGRADGAVVGFTGRIARIARVHQYGLRDRPAPGSRDMQYAQRELLGFNAQERDAIRNLVLVHLTSN